MTKQNASIFLKFALLLVLLSNAVFAGTSFTKTAPIPEDYSSQRLKFINQLKHEVVVDWLKKNFPNSPIDFETLEPALTKDYVIRSKIKRVRAAVKSVEMTGVLDDQGLREWHTLKIAKSGESGIETLFILSSDLGTRMYPQHTESNVRGSVLGQTLFGALSEQLKKTNIRVEATNLLEMSLRYPARKASDIQSLSRYGLARRYRTAFWVHISKCSRCGGSSLSAFFYNLTRKRLVLAKTYNMKMNSGDLTEAGTIRKVLKIPVEKLQKSVEKAIAGGNFSSSTLKVTVRDVPSYRSYKRVESALDRLNSTSQALLTRAQPGRATFEVLTRLSAEEFSKQLASRDFGHFSFEVLEIDSRHLVVRYLGKGPKTRTQ